MDELVDENLRKLMARIKTAPSVKLKTIRYCWFGRRPMTSLGQTRLENWHRYFPGYEIREWNEDYFDDQMAQYSQSPLILNFPIPLFGGIFLCIASPQLSWPSSQS